MSWWKFYFVLQTDKQHAYTVTLFSSYFEGFVQMFVDVYMKFYFASKKYFFLQSLLLTVEAMNTFNFVFSGFQGLKLRIRSTLLIN